MNDIWKHIQSAGVSEIDSVLWEAIQRKRELYPNWDFVFVSLPKDNAQEQNAILHDLIVQLDKESKLK